MVGLKWRFAAEVTFEVLRKYVYAMLIYTISVLAANILHAVLDTTSGPRQDGSKLDFAGTPRRTDQLGDI